MYSPRKTKVAVISLLLLAIVVAAVGVCSVLSTGRRLQVGADQCASVIAFYNRQTHAVCVYSSKRGTTIADRCMDGWHMVSLLSELGTPQGWLCKACSPNSDTGQFVAVGDSKIHSIPIREAGEVGIYDGRIGVACVANRKVLLTYYDLKGRRTSARVLEVSGHEVTAVNSPVTESADGLAAVALSVDLATESRVYVFDKSGGLLADIGPGHQPVVDQKGDSVAYVPSSSPPLRQVQVGLFDIKARTHMRLAAWHPRHPTEMLPYCGPVCLQEVQWSDDGKWLICALQEAKCPDSLVCAVHVQTRHWCQLPIRVLHGRWVITNSSDTVEAE